MAEVLVAGSTGGREHALGFALAGDDAENWINFSHGNAGTAEFGRNLGRTTQAEIVAFAAQNNIDLVVVGPEGPLIDGLADMTRDYGIPTFGPGAEGAQLEGSKAFATTFMEEYDIAHPASYITSDLVNALRYMHLRPAKNYVIKADGPAGGKGVVLPKDDAEAEKIIRGMLSGELFDGAGKTVVFQDRLDTAGPEFSAYMVTDGNDYILLPLAQDHKRLLDGDEGLNTGGMGAYTPLPFMNPALLDGIQDIAEKTLHGMQRRNIADPGVVFIGGMLDAENDMKPSVLEYNVRFGDPETQVILETLRAAGINVYDLLNSAANGKLEKGLPPLTQNLGQAALTVCLAAEGYPDNPQKGDRIFGLEHEYKGVTIHHGGTRRDGNEVLTSGGRVLYVTGRGKDVAEAHDRAYAAIGKDSESGVYFQGMQFRRDIGHQALRKV